MASRNRAPAAVIAEVRVFAESLRERVGRLDPAAADQLARLVRSSVVVHRKCGRKTTQRVLDAAELRRQRVPWSTVYLKVIPNYAKLTAYRRFHETHKLRDAVGHHFRRRKQAAKRRTEEHS